MELTANTIVFHSHNMDEEKEIKFCRTKLMDLRSTKWRNPYIKFEDGLLSHILSSVAWWCKLVKLKSVSWKCQIIYTIYSANLVTVYFSSIWCKALKICICWNAQTFFKTYTEFATKQGSQSLEGKPWQLFLICFDVSVSTKFIHKGRTNIVCLSNPYSKHLPQKEMP